VDVVFICEELVVVGVRWVDRLLEVEKVEEVEE